MFEELVWTKKEGLLCAALVGNSGTYAEIIGRYV